MLKRKNKREASLTMFQQNKKQQKRLKPDTTTWSCKKKPLLEIHFRIFETLILKPLISQLHITYINC